jgi:hypothetical protein
MVSAFRLETIPIGDDGQACTWCSRPIAKNETAVRVAEYPESLPENLRGCYFHSMEHLRSWAQQAALNAMRLIATNDPAYLARPAESVARRDAYSALAQMTFHS